MGKPSGFLEIARQEQPVRDVQVRKRDFKEVYLPSKASSLQQQGARCMDCGVPFCHQGCPLGNIIPDWNDLVYHGRWSVALQRLMATNNFPEWTGRLCPAPCEGACVLGINADPVNIKSIELGIVEHAFAAGTIHPKPPRQRTGKRVGVVGSGPAGLAAADQLNQAGHHVTVLERADRIGGLLRYGIPDFKMEKAIVDRRLQLLQAEGIVFEVGVNVGVDLPADALCQRFDAVLLAGGANQPRDVPVPGRNLQGIHWAMDYLTQQNRRVAGDAPETEAPLHARGKRVIILGGGDTGADCLGTAHRHGASSVAQVEINPCPPNERAVDNPWPQWPRILRTSAAHKEGGDRLYQINTLEFVGNKQGHVTQLRGHNQATQKPLHLDCDLVLIAAGFLGPEPSPLLQGLGLRLTERSTVWRDEQTMTSVPGVFTAGDMQRGQSLIVWAIADGRSAASGIDRYLMGRSALPAPLALYS